MFDWLKKSLGLGAAQPPAASSTVENPFQPAADEEERWQAQYLDAIAGRPDLGVPLARMGAFAQIMGKQATHTGHTLTVTTTGESQFVTTVEVVAVDDAEGFVEGDSIVGLIRVATRFPDSFAMFLNSHLNPFTTIGALRERKDGWYLEMRLAWHETHNAWRDVYRPLLDIAIADAGASMLSALQAVFSGHFEPKRMASAWTEADFAPVQRLMEQLGFPCTMSAGGLTAELPLGGTEKTALLRLTTREPHPSGIAGVFVQLVMPMHFNDVESVDAVADELNADEFEGGGEFYHLGAWCCGLENSLVYVTYLPNPLHPDNGPDSVLINYVMMLMGRAQWAWKEAGDEQ